jgi:microcystin degradation protein MlrC
MRIVAAMMKHETNTFSPVPTPLERFGKNGPLFGDAARDAYAGTATPLGAFITLAEAEGAVLIVPVAAEAWPSGRVDDDAYRVLTDAIMSAVAGGADLVLLDLHGAMVTESLDDGEGELLARVRALAPQAVIGIALDSHGNLSEKMAAHADVVAGFKTYPHTDMRETGEQVGRLALVAARGGPRPVTVWGNRPMLPHIMRQASADQPMKDLIAMARAAEVAGVGAVSVFGGFPHADIADAGLSVTVTDTDRARAEQVRDRILDEAWRRRAEFVFDSIPAKDAVARAKTLDGRPVFLLDHADNCGSGGTQDVTTVLGEMIAQGLEDAVAFAIHDPAAVAALIAAGVGATLTLPLGGKFAMPALGLSGRPLEVTGTVRLISDGQYVIRGPMYTGVTVGMGRSVVFDTGRIEIVVIERHHEPWDVGCLASLGIDPASRRFVMLKSRVHWRAGFQAMARHVVECAGPGVTTSDYGVLHFRRVRRPIYPLDRDAAT